MELTKATEAINLAARMLDVAPTQLPPGLVRKLRELDSLVKRGRGPEAVLRSSQVVGLCVLNFKRKHLRGE
jgi:hypothetical protein